MIYTNILNKVGNTPLVKVALPEIENLNVFAKLEMYNPTGSVKDRAAAYIIEKLLASGQINSETTIIESSSGNFGLALSAVCRHYGLKFYCVIDNNTTPDNERLINVLCSKVIKIVEPDIYGGYLINRIKKVNELKDTIKNSYWVNQYANPLNAEAYYQTLGVELNEAMDKVDYIFIGISSGGTITGISNKIKEKFPNAKIIAVDIQGSVIFGHPPGKRNIPGIGSSIQPEILNKAIIDDVVIVNDIETIKMCNRILMDNYILAGGSSGSVMAAILKYFTMSRPTEKINVLTLFPDRGDRYTSTIFNPEWVKQIEMQEEQQHVISR